MSRVRVPFPAPKNCGCRNGSLSYYVHLLKLTSCSKKVYNISGWRKSACVIGRREPHDRDGYCCGLCRNCLYIFRGIKRQGGKRNHCPGEFETGNKQKKTLKAWWRKEGFWCGKICAGNFGSLFFWAFYALFLWYYLTTTQI